MKFSINNAAFIICLRNLKYASSLPPVNKPINLTKDYDPTKNTLSCARPQLYDKATRMDGRSVHKKIYRLIFWKLVVSGQQNQIINNNLCLKTGVTACFYLLIPWNVKSYVKPLERAFL